MKRLLRPASRLLWALWGLVAWSYALSLVVFMRGFFPPAFEAALGARIPVALAAAALTALGAGTLRALAAALAAAACIILSPEGGGGGRAALAAAVLAWAPFFAAGPGERPDDPPRGLGGELPPAGLAVALVLAAWGLSSRPVGTDAAAFAALLIPLAAAGAWAVSRLLLAPLGLSGLAACLLSLPLGFAAAALSLPRLPARAAVGAAAAAALLGAAAARAMERAPDWSHALQGFVLIASWAATWRLARMAAPIPALSERRAAAAAAVVALGLLVAARGAGPGASTAFARAQAQDPAVRTLSRLLAGAAPNEALFRALWSRMGRPDRPSEAWERPLPPLEKAPARKPDIFILVVDSLRPDLLGPYGSSLGLTPALDAFAKEALVFTRAFTPFGGTHLAVPSLWAGTLLPHGPLPTPFVPLNILERMMDEAGYRKLIAPDIIARAVTKGPPSWETFDESHAVLREACPALADLAVRLGPRGPVPLFAYAHLYDLHIAQVERDEFGGGGGAGAPREPYERSLRSLDACLGTFFAALKKGGRMEDAVVIVTADHADSLGEEGRWGHAHTAFPEVLRIPLFLRVPKALRSGLAVDPGRPALLTDIAPTVGRLLGRGPWTAEPGAGRPLLSAPGDLADGAADVVVGSSYAPVFGLLRNGGRRLFLADAVDRSFHEFILPERGPAQRIPLPDGEAAHLGERLVEALRRLDAYRATRRDSQGAGKAARRT
ncbi:MAG: sulfatase-like hydrolase/transferase [Elusimicrobia bacterium]|nr:sulfatase-like hydrolase/transferase [Elusimicrobiota bacterium]